MLYKHYEYKRYEIVISKSAKEDIKSQKKYILRKFRYREYAENYSKKIKSAISQLSILPNRYSSTGFNYRGYDIYIKPYQSYMIFYTIDTSKKTVVVLRVLQDGMDWENIIVHWLEEFS